MSLFTPITGALGGSIIGLSAVVLLLSNGDVMGCSGIVASSLLQPAKSMNDESQRWKFIFIGSFVFAVNAFTYIVSVSPSNPLNIISPTKASTIAYMIAGLLVGIGTKLGNGCTSGHGVCGLARLSPRSFVSVLSFLTAGIVTATMIASPDSIWATSSEFLRRHESPSSLLSSTLSSAVLLISSCLALLSYSASIKYTEDSKSQQTPAKVYHKKSYGAAASGILFATGLGISGMTQASKVQGFLDFNPLFRSNTISSYDPTLLTVLGAAVPVSALGYLWLHFRNRSTTWCGSDLSGIPTRTDIDGALVIGSILFGIGWGLVGLCPGPGLWSVAAGSSDIISSWFPSYLVGSYFGYQIQTAIRKQSQTKTKTL